MLRPVDLGNPVNRGASLNLGLAHWYRGLPNNRGSRTIFDLCKSSNFTIADGTGYAAAMWSPKHARCDFSPVGGVSPAYYGSSDSNLADFSGGFTASAWIFPVDVSTYNVVAGVTSTGVTNGFYFGQNGAGLILNASPGAVQQGVGPNIAAYSPSFAVWVCSGGAVRLYVDSIEVQNFGGGYSSPAGTSWYIGNSAYGYGTNGGIGSLRFYTRGLTASEIVALYEEELAGCPTTLNRYTPRTVVFLGGAVAAPVSATPGVASLTTTRYAPAVSTPRTATPGVKSLATTKYAPTVSTPRLATIGKLSLTATKYAPSVSTPRLSTPGVKSLSLTPLAPSVSTPRTVTVGVASLSTAVYAPVIATPRTSTPSVASLSLTQCAPTVATPRAAAPGTASLSAAGLAPTVLVPRVTTPGVAALSLTSFAPVAATPRAAVPDAAAVAITSYAPVVVTPRTTTPEAGSLAITAYAPLVSVPQTATPATASLVIATFAPVIAGGSSQVCVPAVRSLIITRYSPTIRIGGTVVFPGGTFKRPPASRIFARPPAGRVLKRPATVARRIFSRCAGTARVFARHPTTAGRIFKGYPRMAAILITKLPIDTNETRAFIFDFSQFDEAKAGETLASATVPAVSGVTIGTPAVLTEDTNFIPAGLGVKVNLSVAAAGTVEIECRGVFSGGSTCVVKGQLIGE